MREMKRGYFRNRKAERLCVYERNKCFAKSERIEILKKILYFIVHWTSIIVTSVVVSFVTTLVIFLLRLHLGI
ncbi:MAG: hypothetical protein Q4G33_11390 [bacterium]|nr:hypothetical protein [bacterium]